MRVPTCRSGHEHMVISWVPNALSTFDTLKPSARSRVGCDGCRVGEHRRVGRRSTGENLAAPLSPGQHPGLLSFPENHRGGDRISADCRRPVR